MRTIVFEEPFSVTVRLEGELTAEAAADLSNRLARWEDLGPGKKVRLDLGDVSSLDSTGAESLRRLRARGIELAVMSPAIQKIASDLQPEPKENLRAWLARVGIQLSPPKPHESASLFRRLLCAVLPPGVAGCPCAR